MSKKKSSYNKGPFEDSFIPVEPGEVGPGSFREVSYHEMDCDITGMVGYSRKAISRHPNSARFHELLQEARIMHDKKQSDYGKDDDPFFNVRASSEWGVDGWVGAMVRLDDKIKRLKTYVRRGTLSNEGVEDNLMDIAVYALIAYVLFEEEQS